MKERHMKKRTRRTRAKTKPANRVRPSNRVLLETAPEFFALPTRTQQVYTNVLSLISRMKQGISRTKAMRGLGLTSRQVDRFGRSAMRKLKNGRYVAKSYDHLLRVVVVISSEGLIEVGTRDSRQASRAGRHSAAVHKYLQTGDASGLTKLKDKYIIDAAGERIELLTELEELDQLGSAGVLSFESLYARGL
jgi:hypothetical protein